MKHRPKRADDRADQHADRKAVAPAAAPAGPKKRRTSRPPRSALLGARTETTPGAVARALEAAGSVAGPIVEAAGNVAESVAGAIVDAARPVVETVTHPVESVESVAKPVVVGAGRRWRASGPGRIRQLRARGRMALPSLWVLHPEARQARPRELGLHTIPLAEIRGTAVEGPTQRGGDFLPIPRLRGTNWLARWQRIRRALDRLEILPPIDVIRYDDGYWVVDGHNRVAAALYAGQEAIDASVVELRPPGRRSENARASVASLAQVAEEGRDVRALGEGRFSRTAAAARPYVELRSGIERRSGRDRREAEAGPPGEDRRSGHDRRDGTDRRSGS